MLKGAEYMNVAGELEKHALEELNHGLIIAGRLSRGMPAVKPLPVRTPEQAEDMLRYDLGKRKQSPVIASASANAKCSVNSHSRRN